jgi:hypothetical protein
MTLHSCKNRLATVWFVGSAVVFLFFLLQSALGKYPGQIQDAWQWFVPTWLPSLSLMLGVFVADATREPGKESQPDRFTYKLARALSIAYLVVLLLTLLLDPVARRLGVADSPLAYLRLSNLWLAPLQGLVGLVLGAFFIKRAQSGGKPLEHPRPGVHAHPHKRFLKRSRPTQKAEGDLNSLQRES